MQQCTDRVSYSEFVCNTSRHIKKGKNKQAKKNNQANKKTPQISNLRRYLKIFLALANEKIPDFQKQMILWVLSLK